MSRRKRQIESFRHRARGPIESRANTSNINVGSSLSSMFSLLLGRDKGYSQAPGDEFDDDADDGVTIAMNEMPTSPIHYQPPIKEKEKISAPLLVPAANGTASGSLIPSTQNIEKDDGWGWEDDEF
jgi:hypothetical protein